MEESATRKIELVKEGGQVGKSEMKSFGNAFLYGLLPDDATRSQDVPFHISRGNQDIS